MHIAAHLNECWRQEVTAPEYAVLLRELDDLGCRFRWTDVDNAAHFTAVCDGQVVAQSSLDRHEHLHTVIHDVLNQAADELEVLA